MKSQLTDRVDMPTPYSVASNHSTVDICQADNMETVGLPIRQTYFLLFAALS